MGRALIISPKIWVLVPSVLLSGLRLQNFWIIQSSCSEPYPGILLVEEPMTRVQVNKFKPTSVFMNSGNIRKSFRKSKLSYIQDWHGEGSEGCSSHFLKICSASENEGSLAVALNIKR